MKRKMNLFGVLLMSFIMILLAFSGLAHNNGTMDKKSTGQPLGAENMIMEMNNNVTTLNFQEIHDLQKFMTYNLIHYGLHSGKLDKLQYKADLNFVTWYIGNFSQIPSSHRGITPQNSSVILPMWENESPQAQSDVQAVANYEVGQYTSQNNINTSYIVNNHLGNLVSNETTVYNNESANLLIYKYTNDDQSLVYELIDQKGSFTPVDPYIRLNSFTIHWGWGGLISGTSYNMYFTFTNYNSALNFKNFLDSALTVQQTATFSETIIFWVLVGAVTGPVGAIVAGIVGALELALGQGTPWSTAQNVNDIFQNQEAYENQFTMVYTLNAWEIGLVPEFSWWGYMYNDPSPGQTTLTQAFKSVGFSNTPEGDFVQAYSDLASYYGTNTQGSFYPPSDWSSTAGSLSAFL